MTPTENRAAAPHVDGAWWQIAGNPALGDLGSPAQQPVDFSIWQAADGKWQLWSCIRGTKAPGQTRLFYAWEGEHLTDSMWTPKGIAMEADPSVGETPGGLQAPYVFRVGGTYHMFYGDWAHVCHATSTDGKTFTRVIQKDGTTAMFSEGADGQTRDPMVLPLRGIYYMFYTANPGGTGRDYLRTSADLTTWSAPTTIAGGGSAGEGPYSAECPFVVYRPIEGAFYLFRTQHYGAVSQTSVYRSSRLDSFGIDDDTHLVETLRIAAPEIVTDGDQEYIASVRETFDGIQLAKVKWGD